MLGWFKTVWVEASTPDEAKTRALDVIGDELHQAGLKTLSGSTVDWNEMEVIEGDSIPETPSGFTFFDMET